LTRYRCFISPKVYFAPEFYFNMNLKEIIIQNNPCNVPLSFIHIQRCASQITNRESLIKVQKRLQNLFEYDSPAVQIIYKRCLSNQKRTRLVTTRSTHLKSHSLAEFYLQCVCVCVCVCGGRGFSLKVADCVCQHGNQILLSAWIVCLELLGISGSDSFIGFVSYLGVRTWFHTCVHECLCDNGD